MKKQTRLLSVVGLLAFCSSAHAQFVPGGVASAGLTYVVPDMAVWYNSGLLPGHPFPGYVTNGPVARAALVGYTTLGNSSLGNGRGDEFVSVVGDSTFLIGLATFADDGSWNGSTNAMAGGVAGTGTPNQRHIVVMQPAGGGPPQIGEAFFDDSGAPYRLHTSLRQKNNAVRVAGDPRLGGTNFITLAMSSLWYGQLWFGVNYFNTDGRFDPTTHALFATGYPSGNNQDGENVPYPGYSIPPTGIDDVQMGTVQTFSLNPATLEQKPASKAQTSAYSRCCLDTVPVNICNNIQRNGGSSTCSNGGNGDNWMGYLGGVVGLDNGNFVSYVSDPSGFFGSPIGSESAVAAIFRPDGTVVKDGFLVDPQQMNANIVAYRGGFCIRVRANLYFYDNAGNLLHTTPVSSSGIGFDTGSRGDNTRLASNIGSHYVYLAGPVGPAGSTVVQLGIWDAQTGAFVTSALVTSDLDPSATVYNNNHTAAVAVDALDRVCVAYQGMPSSSFGVSQILARVLKFDGAGVTYLTPTFFPFVNADNTNNVAANGMQFYTMQNPAVAMTTKQICIAAMGLINSTNNPASGPDTDPVNVYTVINTPLAGVESVGLTHIVPDMLLWYNTNNYYTNGPMIVAQAAPNSTIWDAYDSVVGDSTFLVANVTFANTYTGAGPGVDDLCYALALQPTAGGPPKLGEVFYADNGTPYLGPVSNRKTGNPGRVAGDKRLGAVNFLTAAQCMAGDPFYTGTNFQSDGRWDINAGYVNNGRYSVEQIFSLNPATEVPTPLVKAFDFAYGRTPGAVVGGQKTGFGDVLCLSDGNFAVINADGTGNVYSFGTTATIVIIRPDGSVVKDTFPVDSSATLSADIWANCAAYRGGFCVRWLHTLYFFDNAGNPKGSIDQSSSGVPFGTDRGDQTRLASDIRSHYVYLAGAAPYADGAHSPVYLAVWDATTTNFVTAVVVSDTDPSVHLVQAANVAVDALDRVIVGYNCRPTPAFAQYQVTVRILKFDGTNITPLTRCFFPFVNHVETGTLGIKTITPGLAMTTKQICISAKGQINSTNNPAGGPDTPDNQNLYTVITHPAPVELRPTMAITRSGNNVVLSWADPASLGFTLQTTSPTLTPAAWSPVGNVVQVGGMYYSTNVITSNAYFRLVH